jgi:hypothetical protein
MNMATNHGDYYYLIVREPGRKLVAVDGTGADRGIFWSRSDAENTAALLSADFPYRYDVHRVRSRDDAIEGVIARYLDGKSIF